MSRYNENVMGGLSRYLVEVGMRIGRKEDEDRNDLWDVVAKAITEDIAEWLRQWSQGPVGFDTTADIYNVVRERLRKGIEI